MNYVIIWILSAITFYAGYLLGKDQLNRESIKKSVQKINQLIHPTKVGLIKRPTAKDLYYRNNPKLKETEEEVAKAFKQFPELNESRTAN